MFGSSRVVDSTSRGLSVNNPNTGNTESPIQSLTLWVLADKVVLGAAIVVVPPKQEMTLFVRWCRRLVVQNGTHLATT